MKINAIIQARMNSSRLPGKVLLPACGKTMLELLIERVKQCHFLDEIWVATTVNHPDQAIVDLCESLKIPYYRGDENNVLQRVLDCASISKTDVMVEITGDCPLIDHVMIDKLIEVYKKHEYDFVSNTLKRTYPIGISANVYSTKILEKINTLTDHQVDREHVSVYIRKHPDQFSLFNLELPENQAHAEYRLTLDMPEDYKFIKKIFEALYPFRPDFSLEDIYQFIENNKELLKINSHIRKKPVNYYE